MPKDPTLKKSRFIRQKGFSLPELVIVLLVLAILVTLALPQIISSRRLFRLPHRNWSFDETFLTPNKLPPGTPFFQNVQATGFRQSLY
jgi:prepilin-type N-terminal cleavage/methylation domain-containing protein